MFNSTSNNPNILKVAVTVTFITALAFSPLAFAEEHEHGKESLDYLVVGEHKPINDDLAEYCGKSITVKGKIAERGGIAMIENAEVVKK